MSLSSNPAIALRLELLAGKLEQSHNVFQEQSASILANAATEIIDAMPAGTDVGRAIAFVDSLLQSQSIANNAVTLGTTDQARKKRKAEEKPASELPK